MAAAIWAAIAIIAGVIANVFFASHTGGTKLATWLFTMLAILILCGCAGKAISNRWDGILIDAHNRIALSRLQMLAWTLLVMGGLITAAASNLAIGGSEVALDIDIPEPLLAAMGIAATSLTAAPAILKLKEPDPARRSPAAAARQEPGQASWLDLFRGDEEGDKDKPDLSKIQQFLVTVALVAVYGVGVGDKFFTMGERDLFKTFPSLDEKLIWLLGISHASYLTYMAAPKSPKEGVR